MKRKSYTVTHFKVLLEENGVSEEAVEIAAEAYTHCEVTESFLPNNRLLQIHYTVNNVLLSSFTKSRSKVVITLVFEVQDQYAQCSRHLVKTDLSGFSVCLLFYYCFFYVFFIVFFYCFFMFFIVFLCFLCFFRN